MSSDQEQLLPPNDPATFESLCLDLCREIWGNAQKNGRSGQAQAGVDIFGQTTEGWIGVQCKQKDGLLRTKLTATEVGKEVAAARSFRPPLRRFILATTGPRDAGVQERARELTEPGVFDIEVWSWPDIWHEIYGRRELFARIVRIYWPLQTGVRQRPLAPMVLKGVAERLFGRDQEIQQLEDAWNDPTKHVVTLVAWGGVGKTTLVAKWAARLATRDFDGADYFDWSFYSQGTRDQGSASADAFVDTALRFFGDEAVADSPRSPWDKGGRLAQLVAERRTLLVLDGLEPLQHPPGPLAGELKDLAITALLKGLAQRNRGLCIVTTRESVKDLTAFHGSTALEWELERLSTDSGLELLQSLRVHGSEEDLRQLVEDVDGHALTIDLLGRYLAKAHHGDVRRRDRVDLTTAAEKTRGDHVFKTIRAYETWLASGGVDGERQLAVLSLLGLFDRPASNDCIAALRREPVIEGLTDSLLGIDEAEWNTAVAELAACRLLRYDAAAIDAHPLIREHFARRLRNENTQTWKVAHGRVYEHLRDATERRPDTLRRLQPLYQAVFHGCQAGRGQEVIEEVYFKRILRGREFYTTHKLGAFGSDLGAVACFFEIPWGVVSPSLTKEDQAWILNVAAIRLRALCRLTEAVEPTRAALQTVVDLEDWRNAAIYAGNLSELELMLGALTAAVRDAERAVHLADRSGDAAQRTISRSTLADALHHSARRAEALARFREAEELQAEQQREYPTLYSVQGSMYCDLLLADAERVASRGQCDADLIVKCRHVEERATQALAVDTEHGWPAGIALDFLARGRARFYRALLERTPANAAEADIDLAVERLRSAGTQDFVPRGLVTRAWLRSAIGDRATARTDLDEAQEIAERGPMRLQLADIQLRRARLFNDREALAEARLLIDAHHYERRRDELEDAEAMASSW